MRIPLTADQARFAEEVRVFTATVTPEPLHPSVKEQFNYLVEFQGRLHRAGLSTVAWPVEYGGRGLGPVEYAIVCDELGRVRAPEVVNFVAIDVIAPALLTYIAPSRLRAWLPAIASAEEIWCQLFSEPDAGSDLAALRTVAVPDGEGWRVTGQKVWSTWAQFAHWGLLLARTGSADSRHRGLSAFVVDMTVDGIDMRPLDTMTGSAEFAEVFFDGVRLAPEALVGTLNGGWEVANVMLTAERGPYAIRRSAVLRGALTGLQGLARGVLDSGRRQSVAAATVAMELLDLRIAKVVRVLTEGGTVGFDAALTKLLLGQVEQAIFSAGMDLLGVAGTARAADDAELAGWMERYLYSRAATIYGGTQQIQRNIVGERLLGLPR